MAKILHEKRFIWALFVLIALGIFFTYLVTSIRAGNGNLLMPLDDVYIHFQYAKQMATGHPYQYNNIDPATSGATSFLYPYILAFGYFIGFRGLWLGLWAMLIGTLALIAAMWAVYRLCKAFEAPQWLALLTTVSFALTGSIAWHFMSGMETGLMMALTLWTLLFVVEKHFRSFLVLATFLSLIRPEGGVLAILASGTMFLRLWHNFGAQATGVVHDGTNKSMSSSEAVAERNRHPIKKEMRGGKRLQLLLLAIPILAIGVQPFVNLLITGTTVATGNQAKSILATVPHDWGIIISHILNNFVRMWQEFITGYDGLEGRGWYLPLFTGLLGLLAIPILFFKKNYRLVGLMLLGWLLAMTAAISTLDTAFWHFKRYQMPMMALFFPLAGWVVSLTLAKMGVSPLRPYKNAKYLIYVYLIIILPIFVIALFFQFLHYHAVNVGYVYQQPYQMALWLRENTSEESIVAVHDVGLMRYMGERNTLDIVGLTTPGAAAYWRNGPGSVAEFLINNQPDYIANYGRGHGYGLAYLVDTSLYENELAAFPIENWQRHLNVALAADFQGIYQPEWGDFALRNLQLFLETQCYGSFYGAPIDFDGNHVLAYIDVTDIESEANHKYQWESVINSGFASEVRQFNNRVRTYRLINGYESFELDFGSSDLSALTLVSVVHASAAGSLDIYVDDELIDTQWIPKMQGQQFYLMTLLEKKYLRDDMEIRIVPNIPDSYYMPACHLIKNFYDSVTFAKYPFESDFQSTEALVSYQNVSFFLTHFDFGKPNWTDSHIRLNLSWYSPEGQAQGDYRFFAHLYDDINQPPVVQWDGYFAGMPVGNWLPGYLTDTVNLNIENVPNGTYQLAIGFYNPQNPQDRLIPESDVYEVSPDGRLWLGEITIDKD